MSRIIKNLALSCCVAALCGVFASATVTPRAGLLLIPDNTFNWGTLIRNNYSLEDSAFAVLGVANTFSSTNTFSGPIIVSYATPGLCAVFDSSGTLTSAICSGGGGGTSALAINIDNVQISSPTAKVKFFGNDFIGSLQAGATAFITLNPATTDFIHNQATLQSGTTFYVSSATVNTFNVGTSIRFPDGTVQVSSPPAAGFSNGSLGNVQVAGGGGSFLGRTNYLIWASSTVITSSGNDSTTMLSLTNTDTTHNPITMLITSTGTGNGFRMNANGAAYGNINGVSGAMLVNCGAGTQGECTQFYSSAGAQNQINGVVNIVQDNAAWNTVGLYGLQTADNPQNGIRWDGFDYSCVALIDTMRSASSHNGKFQICSHLNRMQIQTRNAANNSFQNAFWVASSTAPGIVGIGVDFFDPVSTMDVEGSVSIGAAVAGVTAAPINGLLVQGNILNQALGANLTVCTDGSKQLTTSGCSGGGGGGSGTINNGSTLFVPQYSVAGSSNVLSQSTLAVYPSSAVVNGAIILLSTGTLQAGTTAFISSATVNVELHVPKIKSLGSTPVKFYDTFNTQEMEIDSQNVSITNNATVGTHLSVGVGLNGLQNNAFDVLGGASFGFDVGATPTISTNAVSVKGKINTNGGYQIDGNDFASDGGSGFTGLNLVFVGMGAPSSLTGTPASDTCIGNSCSNLTIGSGNVCVGQGTCSQLTSGVDNVAVGHAAGTSISTGTRNVMVGKQAGSALTWGVENVMIGYNTGIGVTTGSDNLLVGNQTASNINTGVQNTVFGVNAFQGALTSSSCTVIGGSDGTANTSTNDQGLVLIGWGANTTGNNPLTNSVAIGYKAVVTSSNTMILGGTGANLLVVKTSSMNVTGQFTTTGGLNFGSLNSSSANYTITSTDTVVAASCPANTNMTDTLPAASASKGQFLSISKVDKSTQTVTINASGTDTIGVSTGTFKLYAPGQTLELRSDGVSNWIVTKAPLQADVLGVPYGAQSAAGVSTSSDTHCSTVFNPDYSVAKGGALSFGVTTGNLDYGIFDIAGNKVASTGNIAVPGSGNQKVTFTSPAYLAPGLYYKCVLFTNTTVTADRVGPDGTVGTCTFSNATGSLPASLTFAGCALSNRVFVDPVTLYGGAAQ